MDSRLSRGGKSHIQRNGISARALYTKRIKAIQIVVYTQRQPETPRPEHPRFGSSAQKNCARYWCAEEIRKIRGHLIGDDTFF